MDDIAAHPQPCVFNQAPIHCSIVNRLGLLLVDISVGSQCIGWRFTLSMGDEKSSTLVFTLPQRANFAYTVAQDTTMLHTRLFHE